MNKKNIIKDALHTSPPQWDREGVWMEIDKQLHPKKNRRRFIILIWFFEFASVTGLFMMSNVYKPMAQDKVSLIVSNDSNKSFPANPSATKDKIKNIEVEATTPLDGNTTSSKTKDKIKNIEVEVTTPLDKNTTSSKTNDESTSNSHPKNSSSAHLIEASRDIQAGNEAVQNKYQDIDKTGDDNTPYQTIAGSQTVAVLAIPDDFPDSNEVRAIRENASVLPPLTTITVDNISSGIASNPIKSPNVDITSKSRKWSTNLSAMYALVHRDLKSTDPLTLNYTNTQNENVSPKEALDISWTIQRHITKNIHFATGVRMVQINEFLITDDVHIHKGAVENDQAYVIYNFSGTEYLSGSRAFEQRLGYTIKSPNKLQRINVPISLISQWQVFGRTLSVGAGADINIFQKYSGINMGLDGNFIYKDVQKFSSIYKKRWVNSVHLNLQLDVWNTNKFTSFVGVNFNKDLNTSVQSQWNIGQKYTWYGVHLGWRYHW